MVHRTPVVAVMLVAAALSSAAQTRPAPRALSPIFRFETDEFWLNLHHFLYVLGRAEAKTPDSSREAVVKAPDDMQAGLPTLGDAEQQQWRAAVTAYANGASKKDVVFDDPLPATAHALADVRDAPTLAGAPVDAVIAATLEYAAPIYRKAWWPAHHAANVEWQAAIQRLVDQHGSAVLAFITRAYGMTWPAAGFPVHVAAYTNWAGAYSTDGNLLVVSSRDPSLDGLHGLETVFHEGMHQWDDQMQALLRAQAQKTGRTPPPGLSHAMIFFTAGEAVRRISPDYTPYAQAFGVWQRGMQSLHAALEATWKPYLDGQGTRDEALAALVAKASER
jgi:hypothetical protein